MTQDKTTAAFRFGYGLPLPALAPAEPASMLAALRGPDTMATTYPGPRLDDLTETLARADSMLRTSRRAETAEANAARQDYRQAIAQLEGVTLMAAKTTFARALDATDGFRERLVQFWADHFTTVARSRRDSPLPATMVEEAIRPYITDRFADMLKAVIQHPAMLGYLDQSRSFGPNSRIGQRRTKGLNENLARELLELHTVGSGYTQDDVTQMAALLTGLTVGKKGPTFDARRAEPGPETVLGTVYEGDTLATVLKALDDLAENPSTAAHLARKLAIHFVSDQPNPDLVQALTDAWRISGGDLLAVTESLLTQPAAWGKMQEKARQPFDFIAAALRALGLDGADVMRMADDVFREVILQPMAAMGQPWQSPPGPDGWSEMAEAWITPETMAARITWAMDMPQRLITPLPDPTALMTRCLGAHLGERLAWAVPKSENIREAVGLVLASPEFNRR
ncbi:MAG: DUF1800 domain-containing protein [Pseudotabrizicola sp.]|uniref:DUF1800 domain-containing protein n=1 Tax=Pseudotabrizicola sp. TaxID=2939647 RepID=UPI002728D8D8|nr:DUF1800 domain-containing protein [Pseudotabrizicola sp.]MDO8885123.1 DUF1800 domain-containing protein [Pseudotabrizicola sp.]MDP2080749.1 DUF1800 domain-containing protein [Pseudotabrizicola sp.]MDZ7574665.1 DUF1800 domain-containing protein [Pseudotabrizicola sp.]